MDEKSAPVVVGRLQRVPVREVWAHEEQHFTPWLLGNVDVLSDLLGMNLVLEVAEHAVGDFSLDLLGHDGNTGEVVIVENQLEQSDHRHLGQILTYAAGTDPTTIVWLATSFREEHRAAIDWLNSRTDELTRFFAVQVEVVRIGSSEPAPAFRIIAQPNDWEKTVRTTAAAQQELSGRQRLYRDFWARWADLTAEQYPDWTRSMHSTTASWYSMTAGIAGAIFSCGFMVRGLISELYFEDPDADVNMRRFERLHRDRATVERKYGGRLEWDPMEGRKATRVCEYLAGAEVEKLGRLGGVPHLAPRPAASTPERYSRRRRGVRRPESITPPGRRWQPILTLTGYRHDRVHHGDDPSDGAHHYARLNRCADIVGGANELCRMETLAQSDVMKLISDMSFLGLLVRLVPRVTTYGSLPGSGSVRPRFCSGCGPARH